MVGHPQLPDTHFGWLQTLGVFFVFLQFLLSIHVWGSLLFQVLPDSVKQSQKLPSMAKLVFSLAFGSLFLAFWIAVFAALGVVGKSYVLPELLFLLSPLLYFRKEFRKNASFAPAMGPSLLILFLVAVRLLDSWRLLPHGDVLMYHLSAPRIWFDTGTFESLLPNPVYLQASFFEYLYQWGNLIFAGEPGQGLVASELFSQMLHAGLGFGGTILCLASIFEYFGLNRWSCVIAALMGANYGSLSWTVSIAKNDFGTTLWGLSGVLFFLIVETWTPALLVTLGVLLGVSFFAKLTSGFFLIIFCLYLFWKFLRWGSFLHAVRNGFCIAGGMILGGMPIWLRNWSLTGNPVFPTLNGVFKSPYLGNSFQAAVDQHHLLHFSGTLTEWLAIWDRLKTESSLFPMMFIGLICIFVSKKVRTVLGEFGWVAWISFVLFLGTVGIKADLRWFGIGWVFLFSVGATGVFLFIQNLPSAKIRKAGLWIVAGLILGFCQFPFHVIGKAVKGKFPSPESQVYNTTAGAAKKWFREHADPKAHVLTTGDTETYFISAWNPIIATVFPAADAMIASQPSMEIFGAFLAANHFKYVLDLKDYQGGRSLQAQAMEPLLQQMRAKVIHEDASGKIYEL